MKTPKLTFCWVIIGTIWSQHGLTNEITEKVREYRIENERNILIEYMQLLKIPNVPSSLIELERNADHLREMMERRGIATRLLEIPGAPPAVYGEIIVPGATKTLMVYAHYDGTPVTPELWQSPPFEPVFRTDFPDRGGIDIDFDDLVFPIDPNIRLFSRSAADDRAPVIAMLAALDAMNAAGIPLSMNIKFFLDGEEEQLSPHLPEIIAEHQDLLQADLWLFCDGPLHQSDRKTLVFGVRGGFRARITLYVAARPLHGGHYGNFSPDPFVEVAHLIASMRDENANVLIDGFYDQVVMPSEQELSIINSQANNDEALKYDIAIRRQESPDKRYEESILMPSLNIYGIQPSATGAISPSISFFFGIMTVPNMQGSAIADRIISHVEKQGYHIVNDDPDADTLRAFDKIAKISWTAGYKPVRTSTENRSSQALISILKEYTNDDMIIMPTMGGALPLSYITDALDTDVIILSIANFDNNQHSPNENIKIGNLWDGMEIIANIFAGLGPSL